MPANQNPGRRCAGPAQEAPPLTGRAALLLKRLKSGKFYPAFGRGIPAAMQELVDAGLVRTSERVVTRWACFVPADGYSPFIPESFHQEPGNHA